jgi:hypothetical protein
MRPVAILMVLTLTACDSSAPIVETSTQPNTDAVTPKLFSDHDSAAACEQAGGQWKAWCVPNTASCVMPWPDGGKQCSDSSQCVSRMCMVDITDYCPADDECEDPVRPEPGDLALGICKREDVSCGSYIEVRNGRAQAPYHVD